MIAITLRHALASLGFPITAQLMAFGGNAELAHYQAATSFTVNVPTATSSAGALAVMASHNVTRERLKKVSGIHVIWVDLTPFKA